jgi:SWI/SNF-related matrix-associated actin-dependent regulator of chromatin subfamily A3
LQAERILVPFKLTRVYSIIFSAWKKTLSLTAVMLKEDNIPFVQMDGSLSHSARHQVLSSFQNDAQTSVLLMTLGTGAVGSVYLIQTTIGSNV